MRTSLLAGLAGLLFGLGLVIAGMTQPAKVIAFLDVFGSWDPSLAFVMVGAIGVNLVAWRLVPRLAAPLSGGGWSLPSRKDIDPRLVGGAALFGVGWGLAGICPGPAITSLGTGSANIALFVLAMVGGMALYQLVERAGRGAPVPAVDA